MKKFFILILSAILCGATSVFAMDPPETEQYNEAYRALPRISIQIIEHQLGVKDIAVLQKLLTSRGSRFQTQDGQVYEINRSEFPALCYLAGEVLPAAAGRADLRRINFMTLYCDHKTEREDDTGIIRHIYGEGKTSITNPFYGYFRDESPTTLLTFEKTKLTFKKVDLQEYVQIDLNKNLNFSEITPFNNLHMNFYKTRDVSEPDDLGSWEDLGSSASLQDPIPEDLLRAQIFSESIVPTPKPPTGFWQYWNGTS